MSEQPIDRLWETVRVNEIATEVFDGPFGSQLKTNDYTPSGVRVVRLENIGHLCFFADKETFISPEKFKTLSRHVLREEDVIFSSFISEEIRVCLLPGAWSEKAINKSDCFCIRVNPRKCLPKFLELRLASRATFTALGESVHGATRPRINLGQLKNYSFGLPPLAEQKRIADKLEAVLRRVDACRARLDRVPALLKRFRQSVLAAATSGKLTEEWRMTNEVNDEWESVTLGSLMDSKPRNGYSPKSVDFETPVRSLTLTATTSGKFRGEYSKFIDEEIPRSSHLWLVPGDILIQRANTIEYVGVSAIYDGPAAKFIYPDLMMKCRANGRTTTGFLHLLLQSDPVRSHFRENATGTAGNMPKINQGTVMSAPATIPTLPEQQEIVRRVEDLFAFAERIEARLATARKTVERLTPATLAKAFRGELVPQDPADEPASALLERLRGSRGEASATKPKRGPRSIGATS